MSTRKTTYPRAVAARLPLLLALLLAALPRPVRAQHNYREALQKGLFFYEVQQSGRLSPNNRVEWTDDNNLKDGQDYTPTTDLSGGWHDAGDTWKTNLTMAFAATNLAWAGVDYGTAYTGTNQMDELLENLWHVNEYFKRCVINPGVTNPNDLIVAIAVADAVVDNPDNHAYWASAVVEDLLKAKGIQRSVLISKATLPASDVVSGMAAAMASSSILFRRHGSLLAARPGFGGFNGAAYSDQLMTYAEKLFNFANQNRNLDTDASTTSKLVIRYLNGAASTVTGSDYRGFTMDKLLLAAAWMHRASLAKNASYGGSWFTRANQVLADPAFNAEDHIWWYRNYDYPSWFKQAAVQMLKCGSTDPIFHRELQQLAARFSLLVNKGIDYDESAGGIIYRMNQRTGFLFQAGMNAALITLFYSDLVTSAPQSYIPGYTLLQQQAAYRAKGVQMIDYALGSNPKNRSYVAGYTNASMNVPSYVQVLHHRTAHGAWAGNLNKEKVQPVYFARARHILYGGLVAGPDYLDRWEESPEVNNDESVLLNRVFRSEPLLCVNSPFDAMLAWMVTNNRGTGGVLPGFPARETRNENLDVNYTDREFFVTANRVSGTTNALRVKATIHNRSRWPARNGNNLSFRYYVTLESGVSAANLTVTPHVSGGATFSVVAAGGNQAYVKADFTGQDIFPGRLDWASPLTNFSLKDVEFTVASSGAWDPANDHSYNGLIATTALLPNLPVYAGTVRVGGTEPTTVVTPTTRLEAENAAYVGPVLATNQAGYSGTGFLDYANAATDYIEWTYSAATAGSYTLTFRYALLSGDRPLELRVNGTVANANLSFPATGAWSTWGTVSTTVTLAAGSNKIRTTAKGSSGGNFDYLEVRAGAARTATLSSGAESADALLKAYPNPAGGQLHVRYRSEAGGPVQIRLRNALSAPLLRTDQAAVAGENHLDLNVSQLKAGVYFLHVQGEKLDLVRKVIIVR